jgi:peptide deformylase
MAILPVVTYNDAVLRLPAQPVESSHPGLQQLIDDMFETMYNAHGIGLAAPQIGRSMALFVIDPDPMIEPPETKPGKMVFINPKIIAYSGDDIEIEEGCLSIPTIRENVVRKDVITITYFDRDFKEHTLTSGGWLSRVIQHEYDHLLGKLFIDYLGSFKRRLLKSRLEEIQAGRVETDYPLAPKH